MRTKYKYYTLIVLLALFWSPLISQDIIYIYMEFSTWKYNDNNRGLVTKISMENDEGELAIEGLTIKYYTVRDGENELIAEAVSDQNGFAKAIFSPDYQFPKDEDGYITVISSFEGSEEYDIAEEELMFIDAAINFSFDIVDEENLLVFDGIIYNSANEELPLADDDIYFYVPRMFSDLKIAEGWFEEDGKGNVEFPDDIIGDSLGQIMVYARILDHMDYGNIEKYAICDWAIPMHPHLRQGAGRTLWTPIAPLWMIITLIITLAGVWGHYIYAIVQLNRIKKLARRQKVT